MRPIRYVALGDSYTIGEGATVQESWPALLARHLSKAGIAVKLAANPSRIGWTVGTAVERALPVFERAKPDFATLLIGVNDWVRGSGVNKFTSGLRTMLDRILAGLSDPRRFLVITIPDFSCAPKGEKYGYGRNITKGISRYNKIIQTEAKMRGIKVVDLFPLSRTFCGKNEMFARDGIHPNAKQYAFWEELIFPAAYELLKPLK